MKNTVNQQSDSDSTDIESLLSDNDDIDYKDTKNRTKRGIAWSVDRSLGTPQSIIYRSGGLRVPIFKRPLIEKSTRDVNIYRPNFID
jgi:hypothetical protein